MQRQPQRSRIFPTSRYLNFKHYYAFGNTPAEDLLQSIAACECRRPTILSLGCGDMRSCMYTIWKNFGFEGENSNGFNGVDFVLNDYNASVLARNILFLYLCMCMPDDEVSRKEWIASMWSLWYNHELQPQHATMLSDALDQLIQWSHTWQEWSECPLGSVVQFSSPATFATVKMVWETWYRKCTMEWRSVNEMKTERSEFQCHHFKKCSVKQTREEMLKMGANRECMVLGNSFVVPSVRFNTMEREYLHYLKEGTVWAEYVLDISSSPSQTVVNPTFYERADEIYSLHYSLAPYSGFIHTFQYTHAEVCRTFGRDNSQLLQLLPVEDHHFENMPLLANSVQQFTMWLVATARIMKKSSSSKISFTFDFDDAITLCYSLLNQSEAFVESGLKVAQFDAIYTSNLFDHLSAPALVLSALQLLKSDGTLFTATFCYEQIASNSTEYLEQVFGFSPALFPTLLGIRCLGHDGQYSSAVNPEPRQEVLFPHQINLLWRNVPSLPHVVDILEESLHSIQPIFKWCTTSSLFSTLTLDIFSVDNFLIILHCFLGKFQPNEHLSYHVLEPLSTVIRTDSLLTSRLLQIQTQSLLHGVHMHITLTEDNCPLCRGQPLETYLQQFTVSFDITAKANVYDAPTFSINLVSFTGDVACVTSVACRSCGPTLALDFFLPKQSLSQYNVFSVNMQKNEQHELVIAGSMYGLVSSKTEYVFLMQNVQPCTTVPKPRNITCPLGSIVKHIGDESTYETVLSMNEACQVALKKSKLIVKHSRSNQLTLTCEALLAKIVYPYAINESKTHIKISKKRNVISVTVERKDSVLYEEKSTFYIDSTNKLALPRFQCNADVMETYCKLQVPLNSPNNPLTNAKHSFVVLFKSALSGEKYFTLSFPSKHVVGTPNVQALVYVHDVRFSTAFSSPVLDVSYCFLDTKPMHLLPDFSIMQNSLGSTRSIMIDDAEYKLLKEIFSYFSTITCCAFSSERHTVTLPVENNQLWKYFDHAILFPLYPNLANPKFQKVQQLAQSVQYSGRTPSPGIILGSQGQSQLASETMNKCSFCDQVSATLKKCARCHKAEYCGRECQLKHWPMHKSACKASDTNPENSTPTQNIASSSPQSQSKSSKKYNPSEEKLHKPSPVVPSSKEQGNGNGSESDASHTLRAVCMRCKKPATISCSCRSVSYCSKTCQTLELPEHSKKCSPPVNSSCTDPYPPRNKDNRDSIATVNLKCSNCNKTKSQLKRCKCHTVSYCSVECQRLHWPQHKYNCSTVRK